jgi:protein SCO1/2
MNRLGVQIAIGGALIVGLLGVVFAMTVGSVAHRAGSHAHVEATSGTVTPGGALQASIMQPPKDVADFTLTDQDGHPFRLSDTNGTVRVIYIGYTRCPDVCPLTMINLKNVRQRLGSLASQVSVVMITADPANDTPDVMKTFIGGFDATFTGLSGSRAELEPVWTEFGAPVQQEPAPGSAAGYTVSHPATLFVLNKDGKLALKIPYGRTVAGITDDLRGLIQ